jgi:hypothetical protein
MAKAKTDVVNWADKLAESAQEVAKAERPALSFISLRGGAISYNGETVAELPVVILAASYDRSYYPNAYDADNIQPPACFAQSMEESMLVPHENVPDPIHPNCAECKFSQWGSATTGSGKGQECKIRRKLAMLPFGAKDYAEAEMAILSVSPTSGRYYSAYANKLAGAGVPPWGTGTTITTTPDAKVQFKVNFEAIAPLDESVLGAVHGRIEAAEAALLTPYDLSTDEEGTEESSKY